MKSVIRIAPAGESMVVLRTFVSVFILLPCRRAVSERHREPPTRLVVEECREDGGRIKKKWQTTPVDGPITTHEGRRSWVPDDAVITDVRVHYRVLDLIYVPAFNEPVGSVVGSRD